MRLTGAAIRFTVYWVDHSLLRALRDILSHGSVEVSADKDKDFYRNKLETVHGVNLSVRAPAGAAAACVMLLCCIVQMLQG